MRTALTDSLTNATANHSLVEVAERAREVWNQARCDRRFRLLLKQSTVPGDIGELLERGTLVAVFREKSAGRGPSYVGPCEVLGTTKDAKYLLGHSGSIIHAEKAHIKLWHDERQIIETRPDPRQLSSMRLPIQPHEEYEPIEEELQIAAQDRRAERDLQRADAYAQLQNTSIQPTRPPIHHGPATGPAFHKLYSNPQTLAQQQDLTTITCPKCRWRLSGGTKGGQKKAHKRDQPGCLLYQPPTPNK